MAQSLGLEQPLGERATLIGEEVPLAVRRKQVVPSTLAMRPSNRQKPVPRASTSDLVNGPNELCELLAGKRESLDQEVEQQP